MHIISIQEGPGLLHENKSVAASKSSLEVDIERLRAQLDKECQNAGTLKQKLQGIILPCSYIFIISLHSFLSSGHSFLYIFNLLQRNVSWMSLIWAISMISRWIRRGWVLFESSVWYVVFYNFLELAFVQYNIGFCTIVKFLNQLLKSWCATQVINLCGFSEMLNLSVHLSLRILTSCW